LRVCILDEDNRLCDEFTALNECVVDRGKYSCITSLEVYCNGRYFTTVSADGIIIATPTGSTAYSLSAGGSVVHPQVPCILFTPICPHYLSFRPLLLPDWTVLTIVNPLQGSSSVWAAIDGQHRLEIRQGMSVLLSMSPYSIPFVLSETQNNETKGWFRSLENILSWNKRIRQRAVEEDVSIHVPPR